jgi:hypothetical protein
MDDSHQNYARGQFQTSICFHQGFSLIRADFDEHITPFIKPVLFE